MALGKGATDSEIVCILGALGTRYISTKRDSNPRRWRIARDGPESDIEHRFRTSKSKSSNW